MYSYYDFLSYFRSRESYLFWAGFSYVFWPRNISNEENLRKTRKGRMRDNECKRGKLEKNEKRPGKRKIKYILIERRRRDEDIKKDSKAETVSKR